MTAASTFSVRIHRRAGPGRTRFVVDELFRRPEVAPELEQRLARAPGVRSYGAPSPLTSRVLVLHDPGANLDAIAEALRTGSSEAATSGSPRAEGDAAADRRQARAPGPATGTPRTPWHARPLDEVLEALGGSLESGLSETEVESRRQRWGLNALPRPAPRSGLQIALEQLESLPVMVLGASAVASLATGGLLDAAMIAGVVAVNAAIGYRTESQSESVLSRLATGVQPGATVIRGGRRQVIAGEELVPGDLVCLERGAYVPADIRIASTEHLAIDESSLTGESDPVRKQTDPVGETVPLGERRSMAYRETVITGGSGLGIVVEIGTRTEVGLIRAMAHEAAPPQTSLQRQMGHLGRQVVVASAALCGGVLVLGLVRRFPALELVKTTISLAVAAIPEGLPTVATTTLALGVRDLEAQGVLVRRLGALESLGTLEAICLDKTGTLTRNQMEVSRLHLDGKRWDRSGEASTEEALGGSEMVRRLFTHATLCSTVTRADSGALDGSPTELALVRYGESLDLDVDALWSRHELELLEDRTKGRNFMKSVHIRSDGRRITSIKGRPDEVLDQCQHVVEAGGFAPLDEERRGQIYRENERMAGAALRVLGVAFEETDLTPGPTWIGLAGLYDPPRPGLAELMDDFHRAGIHTAMITGDQSATAQAIAYDIRLSTQETLEILDSTRIEEIDEEVLGSLARRVDVFSRVSPAHKLQIVTALQRSGLVVGMTGDGVNDGPALRAADVGIAMGRGGTDVARDIADIVLEEDDLSTLLFSVEQGRRIYDDIRKALRFMLSSNASEILVTASCMAAGVPPPLNAMQLLWINVLTDIFPELALSVEPPELDVMSRPPRPSRAPMFSRGDLGRIAGEGALLTLAGLVSYGLGLARYGPGPRASTLGFTSLTSAQLLHAISCRSEPHGIFDQALPRNRWVPLSVGGGLSMQVGASLVPGLRRLLGTVPLGVSDWLVCGVASVTPFLVNEFRKLLHEPPREVSS